MAVKAVLIAGPTASGKSALALALAETLDATIVNADSMQVYREAPILTARPGKAEMARLPHRLYGHVGVRDPYSVGRFAREAAKVLAEIADTAIFVGGTGLYFSALTEGLADIPAVPADIRQRARARLEEIGARALHGELAARDPESASRLRPSDPQRILRAYEVLEATGQPLVHWQAQKASPPILAGISTVKLVLDLPRAALRARIKERLRAMLAQGALQEARALAELDPALPAAKILGLREFALLAKGELSEDEALKRAAIATGQFAKRQSTWFRNRMADWKWLDASDCATIVDDLRTGF
ncbi:MAG: tRNA (adenosine(37)-N6)-dimethylallyltransferase MiaA [Alphaproteobacteria bacterium]|nr:tRNA (adenosine(37)-N6)-dimethylallyltransferase MiaA [Alphaproteobacteria bacterium]MBV9692846.1 tRNA (adenosine(37)-N6)-dimethylallyltransferase MiaA [Alphaproteobacteria bacterium]